MPDVAPFLTTHIILDKFIGIIDCGPKRAIGELIEHIKRIATMENIKYVFLTHIHIDHAGGIGLLLKYLPNAYVVVHPRGAKHLVNPEKLWKSTRKVLGDLATFYGDIEPVIEDRIIIGEDGMNIELGEDNLTIFETPGHSSHSFTFYLENLQAIFPGDLAGVFIEPWKVAFPTTPMPFNYEKAVRSLQMLMNLEPKHIFFPHYGHTDGAMDYLEKYVEKLDLWVKIVEENIDSNYNQILTILLKKDKDLSEKYHLISRHPIWKESIIRSIHGIKSYIEWRKTR